MSKIYRNAILACTIAIAMSFAGAAFAQDAAKPAVAKTDAPKQVTSAKTGKKSASTSPSGEKHISHGKVYLLRGLLNIFSLGMDDLAAKLERRGVAAGVYEYGQWESLCNDAAARVRAGGGPIVLVGHSLGADAVVDMANKLGQMGVPVALVVAFDPTVTNVLTGRTTSTFINYYQSDNGFGRPVMRGAGFRGNLSNVDLRKHTEFGHGSIDKSAMLHNAVIGRVLALVGRGSKPKPTDASAAPALTPAAASSSTPHAETGSVQRTQQ
jgi:pimeloyl-ACP methyl ester carboxylesterase